MPTAKGHGGAVVSIPIWLQPVLDECASCSLDNDADRARLAAAIVAKLTEMSAPLANCIASAARAHHVTRGVPDMGGGMAKQIGANGATSILMLLESE